MYSPKIKGYVSPREEIVSKIVEAIDNDSNLDTDIYKNRILKQLQNGALF